MFTYLNMVKIDLKKNLINGYLTNKINKKLNKKSSLVLEESRSESTCEKDLERCDSVYEVYQAAPHRLYSKKFYLYFETIFLYVIF